MFPLTHRNAQKRQARHSLLALAILLLNLTAFPGGGARTVYASPVRQDGAQPQATPTPTPSRKSPRRTAGVTLSSSSPQPQAAPPQATPTPASRPRTTRAAVPMTTPSASYSYPDPSGRGERTVAQAGDGEGDGDDAADASAEPGFGSDGNGNGGAKASKAGDEKERADKERAERERADKERADKERADKEEKDRLAKELEDARADKNRLEKERADKEAADRQRAAAAEAALNREIERAKTEAAETERKSSEAKLERERLDAAAKLATERADKERLEKERAATAATLEGERKAAEAEKTRLESEREAARARADKSERERAEALASVQQQRLRQQRLDSIVQIAREMNFVEPLDAKKFVADDAADIRTALKAAAAARPELIRLVVAPAAAFCDQKFVGDPFTLDVPDDIPLEALLTKLRFAYNINFQPDTEVLNIPVRVQVENVPWNRVLRSALDFADLDASCGLGNTIQIVKRAKLASIQENRAKSAPLVEEYIKLKYLQPSAGGLVNVAGKSQGGAKGAYESLEEQLNKLLQQGGDTRGVASRVPGKNILFISTTEEKMKRIKNLIAAADKPSYQVFVEAAIYTTNRKKVRDIGVQSSLILGNGVGDILGGISTLPASRNGGSGGSNNSAAGLNPGGVGGLPSGFSTPGGLGAATPNTVFGLSSIIGTTQFSIQATALAQSGAIRIDSRPATLVLDGETGSLNVGRQIPVVVQATNPAQGGVASGQLDVIDAGSILQVTPQVAEGEDGKPAYVTLDLRLESNDADTSIQTSGDIPSVVRRAIQTRLRLGDQQTVIIGGFTTDSLSKTRSKTPGLGDVPVLGNLFKRKLDQETSDRLYFAISVRVIPQDSPLVTVTPTLNTALPAPEAKETTKLPSPDQPNSPSRNQ